MLLYSFSETEWNLEITNANEENATAYSSLYRITILLQYKRDPQPCWTYGSGLLRILRTATKVAIIEAEANKTKCWKVSSCDRCFQMDTPRTHKSNASWAFLKHLLFQWGGGKSVWFEDGSEQQETHRWAPWSPTAP